MKKFMKGCAITALILFVSGLVLAMVAGTVRGRTTIENVVKNVTGGRVSIHLNPFDWGIFVDDSNILGWIDDVDFDVEENMNFDRTHTILKGNVERYSLGSDIRELDFELGACSFTTQLSPDNNFYLEASYAGKLQGYVENGTLYIRSTATVKRWNELNGCRVILYVPADAYFDKAEVEVGAGRLEFDQLQAKEVSLEVGAGQISLNELQSESLEVNVGLGQITLEEMTVGRLNAEIGMGEFVAAGALNGDADVECSMGNVSLTLEGNQKDFNFELSKAMGNVTVGRSSSSGFASEQYLDNQAGKTIDVECSMGNVTIKFTR